MRLPLLGIFVGFEAPAALRSVLLAISRACRPVSCSALEPLPEPTPAGFVWCGSSSHPPEGSRYAVWVSSAGDLQTDVASSATVLLCETPRLVDLADDRALLVPVDSVQATSGLPLSIVKHRPFLPFVRRRLRKARGLPDAMILQGNNDQWYYNDDSQPLPDDLIDTAAAISSVVIATGSALPIALSWAAPTVTDPTSAADLGAVHDIHVVVAAEQDRRFELAGRLVDDEATSARLGHAGWSLLRQRKDLDVMAAELLRRLGMGAHPLAGPLGTLEDQLDRLGTYQESDIRLRLRSLVAPLPARVSPEGVL